MAKHDEMSCKSCAFWEPKGQWQHNPEIGLGLCRRETPKITDSGERAHLMLPGSHGDVMIGHWPATKETDYCGEYLEDVGPVLDGLVMTDDDLRRAAEMEETDAGTSHAGQVDQPQGVPGADSPVALGRKPDDKADDGARHGHKRKRNR